MSYPNATSLYFVLWNMTFIHIRNSSCRGSGYLGDMSRLDNY